MTAALIRAVLVVTGMLAVSLGLLGVFLPLLPTTPFLLLAAACFSRSSERLNRRLLNNRLLGDYIRNYRAGNGMVMQAKIVTLTLLWLSIGYSVLFLPHGPAVKVILLLIAGFVTLHLLLLKTLRAKTPETESKRVERDS